MRKFLVVVLSLLLLACAYRPIPLATSYPITAQRKMQSAHHWDVLAKDLAERIKQTLDISFPDTVIKPSLMLKQVNSRKNAPFDHAFFNLLISRLIQQGLVVTNSHASYVGDHLLIEYNMQVIHHKDRRLTYVPPGIFSALGASAWMVDQATTHWSYPQWSVLPFLVAADINSALEYYLPGETNAEVIITTAMTMGQQYIFGDSRIYYINHGDSDHYEDNNKIYQLVNN